jgi:hypothetical protein
MKTLKFPPRPPSLKARQQEIYERFAYAEYMVANGCPRKDFLEHEEIDFLLDKFLHYLIASKKVKAYQPENTDSKIQS